MDHESRDSRFSGLSDESFNRGPVSVFSCWCDVKSEFIPQLPVFVALPNLEEVDGQGEGRSSFLRAGFFQLLAR